MIDLRQPGSQPDAEQLDVKDLLLTHFQPQLDTEIHAEEEWAALEARHPEGITMPIPIFGRDTPKQRLEKIIGACEKSDYKPAREKLVEDLTDAEKSRTRNMIGKDQTFPDDGRYHDLKGRIRAMELAAAMGEFSTRLGPESMTVFHGMLDKLRGSLRNTTERGEREKSLKDSGDRILHLTNLISKIPVAPTAPLSSSPPGIK